MKDNKLKTVLTVFFLSLFYSLSAQESDIKVYDLKISSEDGENYVSIGLNTLNNLDRIFVKQKGQSCSQTLSESDFEFRIMDRKAKAISADQTVYDFFRYTLTLPINANANCIVVQVKDKSGLYSSEKSIEK